MLQPDPSSSGSARQGEWGLFAVLWLKTPFVVLPVAGCLCIRVCEVQSFRGRGDREVFLQCDRAE